MGFKDAALPAKERALAARIVDGMAAALAEDRLIRTGQVPESWDFDRIDRVRAGR